MYSLNIVRITFSKEECNRNYRELVSKINEKRKSETLKISNSSLQNCYGKIFIKKS